jgi:L-asparaginase II
MAFVPLAECWRGARVESVHFGAFVLATGEGALVGWAGDPDALIYPRSSLKPFQALPLVESGAADALGLSDEELALACASHRAEPRQVAIVARWLERIGLTEAALICGPDWPRATEERDQLVRAGAAASRLYHNCSGKHVGLLSQCVHLDCPTHGYEAHGHPIQQKLLAIFESIAGRRLAADDLGVDGCNLPAPVFKLRAMAAAVARYAACEDASPQRAGAMARLMAAMTRHPDLISGPGQPTERLLRATGGRVVAKTGAEGVLTAWLPHDRLGAVVKISDGAPRARFAVLIEALGALGLLSRGEIAALEDLRTPPISNSVGKSVGRLSSNVRLETHVATSSSALG